MFIVKNLTDFRKTVETGADPRLDSKKKNVNEHFISAENLASHFPVWLAANHMIDTL